MILADGWTFLPINGYRYRITTTKQSWQASRDICQGWGGDLIVHGIQVAATRE